MAVTYHSPGVYVEEKPAGSRPIEGAGTAIAAFVGFTELGEAHKPTLVTNWSQYVEHFGGFVAGRYLPLAVQQYFNNGGGQAYIVKVNGSVGAAPVVPAAALSSASREGIGAYQVVAKNSSDVDLSVAIERPAAPPPDEHGNQGPADEDTFTLIVKRGGQEVERFEGLQPKTRKPSVVATVNERSQFVTIEELSGLASAERVPAVGETRLAVGGTEPVEVSPEEYRGDSTARTGLGGLEAIEDITMVAIPDLMALYQQGAIDLEGVLMLQTALVDHCSGMANRMAILDTPPGLNPQQVKDYRLQANFSSPFATMYWPWIKVMDPAAKAAAFIPPSGAVAGIWGRNDDTRGVHKAPANEVVRGAIDIEVNVNRKEHDILNPIGVNVIRSFPGQGIRIWGARTLAGSSSEWRYVNVRRYFNYLETSILNGTQWVVFEPNDLDLWQRIRRTLNAFLTVEWRNGRLFGATPDEAFFVKCDAELNPASVRDQGYVVCEVGVAPVKPAEFVVFRLSQYSGGSDVAE